MSTDLICQECGVTFTVSPSRADTAKYCSRDCQNAREEVTCKGCGDVFEALPSRDRKFCSKGCSHEYHTGDNHPNKKPGVVRTCHECGEDFRRPKWKAEKAERDFCSEDCRGEWVSDFMSGRFTGKDHPMYGIDPEDHPMYAGGAFPYGPGFTDAKKEKVRERDGRECQHCGRGEAEHLEKYRCKHHVHHIRKARNMDDPDERNAMSNLITLCHGKCHATWEKMSPLRPQ